MSMVDLQGVHILLANPKAEVIQSLAHILAPLNVDLYFVATIKSAINILKSQNIEIVISSVIFDDLNNSDFIKICDESKKSDIPVLCIRNKADVFSTAMAYNLGASDSITYPFESEEVISRVRIHYTYRKKFLQMKKDIEDLMAK